MAKLVAFQTPQGAEVYVNSELIRAVVPAHNSAGGIVSGQSQIVYGEREAIGTVVMGSPREVADKLIG